MYKNIGIDLGASGVVVSIAGEGIFSLRDVPPALRRKDGSFPGFGVGEDQNGTDGNGEVTPRSASHEITVDPEACRLVLSEVITHYSSQGQVPRLLLSIPCGFGEVEENVLVETAVEAGARDVYLLYSPLAALLGNELDPSLSAVVVDIGAVRTNMIAVCRGRMIYKKTFLVGGDDFDRAIAGYMLNKSKVAIDPETAEEVKIGVGTVWIANERRMMEVHGRDATNGDYCTVRISSEEMFTALEEPMAALIEGVCKTITKIPSDCVQDVFDTGILLTGGGCLLEGIDKMISGVTGVNASRLANPRRTVAEGLVRLLSTEENFQAAGTHNISRYMMKSSARPKEGAE